MRLTKLGLQAVAPVLLAPACAPGHIDPTGTLELPLSVAQGDRTLRFLGTVRIVSTENSSVATTFSSDEASPATHRVPLSPGAYAIQVEDGYECRVTPEDPTFSGCTYKDAIPNPLAVAVGTSTEAVLTFVFHFDQDVEVGFRTGDARVSVAAEIEGACYPGCRDDQLCVAYEGGAPACAKTCSGNSDCSLEHACYGLNDGQPRFCGPLPGGIVWTTQFGSTADDRAMDVSADGAGNTYVAGRSEGVLSGQTSSGNSDAFIAKFDPKGDVIWTRQFGGNNYDSAETTQALATGVVVAGIASRALPGQTHAGGMDAFVRKYDKDGAVIWTRQFGSAGRDEASSIRADPQGNLYVAGLMNGDGPGLKLGEGPQFVAKLDAGGSILWTHKFGHSSASELPTVTVDAVGHAIVAGTTLENDSGAANTSVFVTKYDSDGAVVWTRAFGGTGLDWATGVAVTENDDIVLAGVTSMELPGRTGAGNFVRRYDADGNELWTRPVVAGVTPTLTVASSGDVAVAADLGVTSSVLRLGPDGTEVWSRTLVFPGPANSAVNRLGVDESDHLFLAGYVIGALPGETAASANRPDAFLIKVAPP